MTYEQYTKDTQQEPTTWQLLKTTLKTLYNLLKKLTKTTLKTINKILKWIDKQ